MGTRRFASLLSFAVLILASRLALAQLSQPDETLPGFHAQDILFSGTYDNVNAYSGDDGVVIPIIRREATASPHRATTTIMHGSI